MLYNTLLYKSIVKTMNWHTILLSDTVPIKVSFFKIIFENKKKNGKQNSAPFIASDINFTDSNFRYKTTRTIPKNQSEILKF